MKILIIRPQVKKILLLITLLCAMVQGAWAQNEWDAVYTQTQTTSADWTALDAGSSTGKTLGSAGTTTYYYATGNLNFTNSNAGGSGLNIQGTVYLYVPSGMTFTCKGANASGQMGGGAGIELTAGNTLYLIGSGKLVATGGNAANGGNGGNGGDADWDNSYTSGDGGNGGHGGGFGGAASNIGTGGPGGGGGGGGASGSIQNRLSSGSYYKVGALGGNPGVNADGTTTARPGASTEMVNTENLSKDNAYGYNYHNSGWQDGDNRAAGGSGGGRGSVSKSSTAKAVTVAWPAHTLTDGSDNTAFITAHDGDIYDITLTGRTLYKDGKWNTLCLPFDLGNLSGTPLENATLMTLSSSNYDNGTLTLNFESATTIAAGKPYIVKWTTTGENISSPIFNGVTISSTPADVETTAVTFKGNYDYLGFTEENRSILFLGTQNKLYYPLSGASIGACRAYFQLNGGITAGDPASAAPVRAFVLNLGGEATGIQGLTPDPSSKGEGSEYWYSLDGRRLSQRPSRAGIYINNGKMVVIK